ncbi:hypothetical protein TruAng_001872 [Truncatella angustata]|nr:hypothetical protein TruAng_001872 [Truncatella angustata]
MVGSQRNQIQQDLLLGGTDVEWGPFFIPENNSLLRSIPPHTIPPPELDLDVLSWSEAESQSSASDATELALPQEDLYFDHPTTSISEEDRGPHAKRFKCHHSDCTYATHCQRDLQRHLRCKKHRDASAAAPDNLFHCEFSTCKFFVEGFTRRDNLWRHRRNAHGIKV